MNDSREQTPPSSTPVAAIDPNASPRWAFWIDRGGTFTDCVARAPNGALHVCKTLSGPNSVAAVIRLALDIDATAPVPPCDIRMGTTVATNALLEGEGARTALVVTRGFADLCRIGTGTRPDLFALHFTPPTPLYDVVAEVSTRIDTGGNLLASATDDEVERVAEACVAGGIESVTVSVLGATHQKSHEVAVAERLSAALVARGSSALVTAATAVSATLGYLGRSETALVDARLSPLLANYLERHRRALPHAQTALMQSSGALCPPALFRGPSAVLSGPAGGVVAARAVAALSRESGAIAFDMGGTSTDVSTVDVTMPLEHKFEAQVAGVRVRAPMLDIHTVAAGGGSVCAFDGARFDVGPKSVGASPGPLCYGNATATALSVTDVNLVLGRLVEDRFPFSLDKDRASAALASIAERSGRTVESAGAGFLSVANAKMAEAISRITVGRGVDASKRALVVLGGAGGQHACAVADQLRIERVLWHPFAGVLSAFGMGLAQTSITKSASANMAPLDDSSLCALQPTIEGLWNSAAIALNEAAKLDGHGTAPPPTLSTRVALRYAKTESDLVVTAVNSFTFAASDDEGSPLGPTLFDCETLRAAFERAHRTRFGTVREGAAIEVASLHVEATIESAPPPPLPAPPAHAALPIRTTRLFSPADASGQMQDAPVFERSAVGAAQRIHGPALILDATGAFVVDVGWVARADASGTIAITRESAIASDTAARPKHVEDDATPDPVRLTLFGNAFMACAEQMGEVLEQTAVSTNIRERLDFSCAVFSATGELIANAPHIPVHLGAMSESVRAVLARHPATEMKEGDAFVTNDPAEGGSHLPDITCVAPVFLPGPHTHVGPAFFVASRGHHADVGGTTPGSMPPDSTTLAEEGAVLSALRICREGVLDVKAVTDALTNCAYPARDVDMNLADLAAQLAANETGKRLLLNLADEWGHSTVKAYMGHLLDDAEARVRTAIARLGLQSGDASSDLVTNASDGNDVGNDLGENLSNGRTFTDFLDDGSKISVKLFIEGEQLVVDFEGTAPEHPQNLNAPRAVTLACVMYALRVLVDAPVPLSEGFLRPISVRIPPRSLLSPSRGRAVAAGNVETSQRIVDVVLAALGLCAASQGTMNNVTFGDDTFGYYETLGGGHGAGPTFDGPSAAQVHMTNTRLTDPELVEARHPIRIRRLEIRRGSGGAGRQKGGDGLVREYELLRDLDVSLLTERRTVAPFGLEGGDAAAMGENAVDGKAVAGRLHQKLKRGQILVVKTPGGGGFGPKAE